MKVTLKLYGNKTLTVVYYGEKRKWGIDLLCFTPLRRFCHSYIPLYCRRSICIVWVNSFVWFALGVTRAEWGTRLISIPEQRHTHCIWYGTFEWILQITMPSVGPNKPHAALAAPPPSPPSSSSSVSPSPPYTVAQFRSQMCKHRHVWSARIIAPVKNNHHHRRPADISENRRLVSWVALTQSGFSFYFHTRGPLLIQFVFFCQPFSSISLQCLNEWCAFCLHNYHLWVSAQSKVDILLDCILGTCERDVCSSLWSSLCSFPYTRMEVVDKNNWHLI